jgi:hypothetical protein
MENEILKLFKNTKNQITDVVSKQLDSESLDESLKSDMEKQKVIVQCYQILTKSKS